MSEGAIWYLQQQYIKVMKLNEPERWHEPLAYSDGHCADLAVIEARYVVALEHALADERSRFAARAQRQERSAVLSRIYDNPDRYIEEKPAAEAGTTTVRLRGDSVLAGLLVHGEWRTSEVVNKLCAGCSTEELAAFVSAVDEEAADGGQ